MSGVRTWAAVVYISGVLVCACSADEPAAVPANTDASTEADSGSAETTQPDVPDVSEPPGPPCGDGACDEGETDASCPDDCAGPGVLPECIAEFCPEAGQACEQVPTCVELSVCFMGCESGDGDCSLDCAEGYDSQVKSASGTVMACFRDICEVTTTCGDGFCQGTETLESCPEDCTPTVCGDGVCDLDETPESCLEDCPLPPDPVYQCIVQGCEAATCQEDPACDAVLQCFAQCTGLACLDECVLDAPAGSEELLLDIEVCALDECIEGTGTPGSCLDSCGGPAPGEACWCDPTCDEFDDCCDDYQLLCSETPGCGDGTCVDPENHGNCAADCPADSPLACLQASCDVAACQALLPCATVLICLAECEDSDCGAICIQDAPAPALGLLLAAQECALENACHAVQPPTGRP
ncbi:MAG: hypothetical protein ACI9WU_004286 [Myxococcota bacterium]